MTSETKTARRDFFIECWWSNRRHRPKEKKSDQTKPRCIDVASRSPLWLEMEANQPVTSTNIGWRPARIQRSIV